MSVVPPAIRTPVQRSTEPVYDRHCWLAHHGVWEGPGRMPSCDGRLVKAHLIPRQTILRELPAEFSAGQVWNDGVWVWGCGGPGFGNTGHHGHFDLTKKIRVPRHEIPARTEAFAREWGLDWWLDRTYGTRE